MEEEKKILVVNDESAFNPLGLNGLDKILGSPASANTTNGMDCMVKGCKNKAAHGTTTLALCEKHMHLAFKTGTYKRPIPKIGRNEKCICGSGKKFKHCCGR